MNSTDTNYDAGEHWLKKGELETATKWRTAFAAFVQGMTQKEISDHTGLEYASIRRKATDDDWAAARQQIVLSRVEHRVATVDNIERQIARIKENREKNLAGAVELRDYALDIVHRLKSGTLTLQKQFHNKGSIVTIDVPPSTGDMVNIATFLRTIADLTYRALGDAPADSKQTPASASASGMSGPPGITVILPSVAVHPRPRRHETKQAVVDVSADVVEQVQPDVAMPPSPPQDEPLEAATT